MTNAGITFYSISGCEGKNAIEPSIHTLQIDGDTLVLDTGFMSTGHGGIYREENRMKAALKKLDTAKPKPSAILVSHAHLDHIGLLAHAFFVIKDAPIFMTGFTRDLAKIILRDAAKVSPSYYSEELCRIYEQTTGRRSNAEEIITEVLNSKRIQTCSFEEGKTEAQFSGVKVKALRAGHIPGAASFLIKGKAGSTVMYSGDYSRTDFLTVKAAPDPPLNQQKVDLMITEATYGDKNQPQTRSQEITAFISQIRGILSKRGRILIPSFALGRAQEILAILLKSMKENNDLQTYPIRIMGMARNVTYLCTEDQKNVYVTPWAAKNFGELFSQCMYAGCSQGLVQFPASNYEVENALIYDNGPAVFIAPSGMLSGGWSPKIASYLAKESESAILFVGYQDEESPGHKFVDLLTQNQPNPTVELKVDPDKPPQTVKLSCLIGDYRLSAHATGREIEEFVVKWQPKNIFLVHGPTIEAKQSLESAIQSRLDARVVIPRNSVQYNL